MDKFRKIRVYAFWFIVGAVLSEVEFCVWSLIYKIHLFNESAMLIIPVVLFWLLSYHSQVLKTKQKEITHYFLKSVLCIYIGWIISYICLYYNADSLGVLISIVIATALTLFLVCMKIIQLFYNKMKFRQVYFGYTVLGGLQL